MNMFLTLLLMKFLLRNDDYRNIIKIPFLYDFSTFLRIMIDDNMD